MKKTILLAGTIIILSACNNNHYTDPGASNESYQQQVLSIEEIERSEPTNFLSADGTYNENFFGNKLKIHGVVKNTATVATYKDAVIRVSYYSKTKTVLATNNYTIYD